MQKPKDTKFDRKAVVKAAEVLQQTRTGIVLTGRVVKGRIELDETTLKDISQKYPDAEFSFVAVNAPFDPVSQSV
ncbi:MAG TPA: hypothetical protein VHH35_07930 [Pyrinomonadaceae bacterium]|nr:hypothetical protein [Pyrinomonadaceae bacterium]